MYQAYLSLLVPIIFAALAVLTYTCASRAASWNLLSRRMRYRTMVRRIFFFGAFFLAAAALSGFAVTNAKKDAAHYLFLFDTTFSQMVEDYVSYEGLPMSRLAAAKRAFVKSLDVLPPQARISTAFLYGGISKVSIVATAVRADDRNLLIRSLEVVEWWNISDNGSGFSGFEDELFRIASTWRKPFNIIVFTDGDYTYGPEDEGTFVSKQQSFLAQGVKFLFVGVAKNAPQTVPAFDKRGKKSGCLSFGESDCYKSSLNSEYLRRIASRYGGEYLPVEDEEAFHNWLLSEALVDRGGVEEEVSYEWLIGIGSLLLFMLWIVL